MNISDETLNEDLETILEKYYQGPLTQATFGAIFFFAILTTICSPLRCNLLQLYRDVSPISLEFRFYTT